MKLVSVYADFGASCVVLYKLLAEREPHQSISHKEMPTFEDHCAFVLRRPYQAWYLIDHAFPAWPSSICGAVYLTKQREIGIGILKDKRGNGYALDAVSELMRLHPGRFVANINPANEPSIRLFQKLGFGPQPLQITLEKP